MKMCKKVGMSPKQIELVNNAIKHIEKCEFELYYDIDDEMVTILCGIDPDFTTMINIHLTGDTIYVFPLKNMFSIHDNGELFWNVVDSYHNGKNDMKTWASTYNGHKLDFHTWKQSK
jgi:hypothetical protein